MKSTNFRGSDFPFLTVWSHYYSVYNVWKLCFQSLVQYSCDYTAVFFSLISSLHLSRCWLFSERRNKSSSYNSQHFISQSSAYSVVGGGLYWKRNGYNSIQYDCLSVYLFIPTHRQSNLRYCCLRFLHNPFSSMGTWRCCRFWCSEGIITALYFHQVSVQCVSVMRTINI